MSVGGHPANQTPMHPLQYSQGWVPNQPGQIPYQRGPNPLQHGLDCLPYQQNQTPYQDYHGQFPPQQGQIPCQQGGQMAYQQSQILCQHDQISQQQGQSQYQRAQVPYEQYQTPHQWGQSPHQQGQILQQQGHVSDQNAQISYHPGQDPHQQIHIFQQQGQTPYHVGQILSQQSRISHQQGQISDQQCIQIQRTHFIRQNNENPNAGNILATQTAQQMEPGMAGQSPQQLSYYSQIAGTNDAIRDQNRNHIPGLDRNENDPSLLPSSLASNTNASYVRMTNDSRSASLSPERTTSENGVSLLARAVVNYPASDTDVDLHLHQVPGNPGQVERNQSKTVGVPAGSNVPNPLQDCFGPSNANANITDQCVGASGLIEALESQFTKFTEVTAPSGAQNRRPEQTYFIKRPNGETNREIPLEQRPNNFGFPQNAVDSGRFGPTFGEYGLQQRQFSRPEPLTNQAPFWNQGAFDPNSIRHRLSAICLDSSQQQPAFPDMYCGDSFSRLPTLSRAAYPFSAAGGPQTIPGETFMARDRPLFPQIRKGLATMLQDYISPGYIVQVCGPPMAGKKTMITTVVENMKKCRAAAGGSAIIVTDISCERCALVQEVMGHLAWKMELRDVTGPDGDVDESRLLTKIAAFLAGTKHIFIFYKCEKLRANSEDTGFLNFLQNLSQTGPDVTIVFSSYRKFPSTDPHRMRTVELGMLDDPLDVLAILRFYAPTAPCVDYGHYCQRLLPLPGAIRKIALDLIDQEEFRISPEDLGSHVQRRQFLSSLFQPRTKEVEEWVGRDVLMKLSHFCGGVGQSFTENYLKDTSTDKNTEEWTTLLKYLKENFIVYEEPGVSRLCVHPLVVFYYLTSLKAGMQLTYGQQYDHSTNRFTSFLCRILANFDSSQRLHGRKGLVYGHMIQEQHHFRHAVELALHCNTNTYKNFVRVVLKGGGPIMKFFSGEALPLFESLFEGAKVYGTPVERAVIQSYLAQSMAMGQEDDMKHAMENQAMAVQELSKYPPSYHLLEARKRQAVLLYRRGKYNDSQKMLHESLAMAEKVDCYALGPDFAVSPLKMEELVISLEIYETIPLIFRNDNDTAMKKNRKILETITDRCENHPDLAVLLNNLGLIEQRKANNDLDAAIKWYQLSLQERLPLEKLRPGELIVPLNNIGMLLLRRGAIAESINYLEKALKICHQHGWVKFGTALTLMHLSDVMMKCQRYIEAFKHALDALSILLQIYKDHEMCLKGIVSLAHIRLALKYQLGEATTYSYCRGACSCATQLPSRDHELPELHYEVTPDNEWRFQKHDGTSICIEPHSLEKTSIAYFKQVLSMCEIMKDTLSGDGHSNILTAYMHLALYNWSDEDKRNEYMEAYCKHFVECTRSDEKIQKQYSIERHVNLYEAWTSQQGTSLNIEDFSQLAYRACMTCTWEGNFFNPTTWCVESRLETERRLEMRHIATLRRPKIIGETDQNLQSSLAHPEVPQSQNARSSSGFMLNAEQSNICPNIVDSQEKILQDIKSGKGVESVSQKSQDFQKSQERNSCRSLTSWDNISNGKASQVLSKHLNTSHGETLSLSEAKSHENGKIDLNGLFTETYQSSKDEEHSVVGVPQNTLNMNNSESDMLKPKPTPSHEQSNCFNQVCEQNTPLHDTDQSLFCKGRHINTSLHNKTDWVSGSIDENKNNPKTDQNQFRIHSTKDEDPKIKRLSSDSGFQSPPQSTDAKGDKLEGTEADAGSADLVRNQQTGQEDRVQDGNKKRQPVEEEWDWDDNPN